MDKSEWLTRIIEYGFFSSFSKKFYKILLNEAKHENYFYSDRTSSTLYLYQFFQIKSNKFFKEKLKT